MGDFGFKSSIEGEDVKSAADENKTFFSKYEHPKTKIYADPSHFDFLSYTFTSEPGNGTTTLFTKAHGFSYQPAHLTMIGVDNGSKFIYSFAPYYQFSIELIPPFRTFEDLFYVYTGGTNLQIKHKRTNGGALTLNNTTWKFKYNIWAADGS